LELQVKCGAARVLLEPGKVGRRALVLVSVMVSACVIPIPAEVDQPDASPANSPPVIVESNPSMPGFVDINISNPTDRSITVKDNNIADTLYVRVFRDYQDAALGPLIDASVPNDPVIGTATRIVQLPTNTWCNGATLGTDHVFDVVVADRPFNPNPAVPPAYRALPPGAEFSIRSWVSKCVQGP
jgi:hypothetical protein